MEGWIKIHRTLSSHWVFDDAERFKAWIIMLFTVNYESGQSIINGELVKCDRGQSTLSLSKWAGKFGKNWTVQKVKTFFILLEKDQMIVREGLKKTTKITICNYENYQNEQPNIGHFSKSQNAQQENCESVSYGKLQLTDAITDNSQTNSTNNLQTNSQITQQEDCESGSYGKLQLTDAITDSEQNNSQTNYNIRRKNKRKNKQKEFEPNGSCQLSAKADEYSILDKLPHEVIGVRPEIEKSSDKFFGEVCEVVEYLNLKIGKRRKPEATSSKFIRGRLSDGFKVEDLKLVIDLKVEEWFGNKTMEKFLRSDTLFNPTKFEKYFEEVLDSGIGKVAVAGLAKGDVLTADCLMRFDDEDILTVNFKSADENAALSANGVKMLSKHIKAGIRLNRGEYIFVNTSN